MNTSEYGKLTSGTFWMNEAASALWEDTGPDGEKFRHELRVALQTELTELAQGTFRTLEISSFDGIVMACLET